MAYRYSRSLSAMIAGLCDSGTLTSTANIDTAFVFETSGDCFFARFVAPVSQSAATLTFYAFLSAVTGTPDFQVEVREGYSGTGDADRPKTGGSNIGSSSSTVSAPSANTWLTWTVTCSLTAGDTYWVLVKNTHGTPASNHGTFVYRGPVDGFTNASVGAYGALAGYTTDGFATDPTVNSSAMGTFVIKFSDGSLLGFPLVASSSHANNTNNRGLRFNFTEDVVVSGVVLNAHNSAALTGIKIASGGSVLLTETGDSSSAGNNGSRQIFRFAPMTFTGGTNYDVYATFGSNSAVGTFYTMGQAEGSVPTDVKACFPSYLVGSIDSSNDSFTPDTSQAQFMHLIIDDNPAIAGGSSGGGPLVGGRLVA